MFHLFDAPNENRPYTNREDKGYNSGSLDRLCAKTKRDINIFVCSLPDIYLYDT